MYLQELVDDDASEGSDEHDALLNHFLHSNILPSLVSLLSKLDESIEDDSTTLHNVLSLVETVLEMEEEIMKEDIVSTSLFNWLLKRSCQKGAFDANKVIYSSHAYEF